MLVIRGTSDASIAAQVAGVGTLADVARRFRIVQVVVQDEFTHDVLVSLPDGRALAFDAT
jgi:hypothetical protein